MFTAPQHLRQLFNSGPYMEWITQGALSLEYLRNDHLKAPDAKGNQPCTRRQMIRYLDAQGNPVVEVFQYLRRDGSLGASGRPDPKRLWVADGRVLFTR